MTRIALSTALCLLLIMPTQAAVLPSPFDILLTPVTSPPLKNMAHPYKNGMEYTGEWKNGLPDGDGNLRLADGSMFVGSFKAGLPNGIGVLQDTKGNTYNGEWNNGRREGLGIMEYAGGNRYEGAWHQDVREGKGSLVFPSGTRFQGLWHNDLRHGRGTLLYKTGERYSGDYAYDLQHGHGSVVESDGSAYSGTFSRGKRHGVGDCTDRDGRAETCVYNKGVRVTDAAVLARANSFKARFEPKFEFTEGVTLLWEDNFSKGKGLLSEKNVTFKRKSAMLRSELKIESKGNDFYLLIVIPEYKGVGQYRLNGEDVVVTLDGDIPLFLAGNDAGQLDITADRDAMIEGQIVAPKLYENGDPKLHSYAIRRGQFRAIAKDFDDLKPLAMQPLLKLKKPEKKR